ncbi:hypothetical protein MKW98_022866 [Papaver atlanticum]|uniref:ABC transporter domain-containing protein n=1 Tax=Papaver atlanticum TaxID=357466 RepID=A0AAD4XYS5_9MAGN|nr:hypothetical protein MKW98_022866 [Papaver atlanticum]
MAKSSFTTQTNALFLKNITFQKRNIWENLRLIAFPILLLVFLQQLQKFSASMKKQQIAGPGIPGHEGDDIPELPGGFGMFGKEQPPHSENPVYLHIPWPESRAVKNEFMPYNDLPDESCRATKSCPVTVLVTGLNESLGQELGMNLFAASPTLNFSASTPMDDGVYFVEGDEDGVQSFIHTSRKNQIASRGVSLNSTVTPVDRSVLLLVNERKVIQAQCKQVRHSVLNLPVQTPSGLTCVQGLGLWRNSSLSVNDELFGGYWQRNPKQEVNEIFTAYDFLNSDVTNFNVNVWYSSTSLPSSGASLMALLGGTSPPSWILRTVNMASNAYLTFLNGTGIKVLLDYVTDMPQTHPLRRSDMMDVMVSMALTLFLPLLFTWIILQLFPVMLTSLVYEKQQKLRVMMRMHGLGDGPYWMITYSYFLFLSSVYILGFMVSGYLIGLPIFKCTAFSILFTFYFTYINLQISFAFLMATLFLHVKTATVIAHMFVFGSGLLGINVFQSVLQSPSFSEMFPPFALHRGNYEFQEYTQRERYLGYAVKMSWNDINDGENGMRRVLILMAIEWFVMLIVAYYLDQVISLGNGREKVKELILSNDTTDSIVCDNLKKVYPSIDGNPEKVAVRGLSLALGRGECFGMLGPNGAGKTSFISMMIGLTEPTSGMALVNGLDIQTDMDQIYASMGVCPQHDLLWETLTGGEHLLFYGRLKNLKGSDLTEAVEESLKSVNLYHGGVADIQARTYSGGMKRRLSVAISLIGDPKVVYMDEPSTGLDPSSRNHLWNIVKRAKKDRAIILTTHSMEEAEALCDRLGIFADGSLQCIGNPKELKARYGGSYVFTMTTSVDQEKEVEKLVRGLSSNANKIYHLSGTQKFEISKKDVRIGDVFRAVENAKREFPIYAWGLTDTTLEDVFIKVAQAALASSSTM